MSVSMSLYCVMKLLSASKHLEHLTGAERKKIESKSNGTKSNKSNGNISSELKLSRPLHQIIEDAFKEEVRRLSVKKTSSLSPEELINIKPGNVRKLTNKLENNRVTGPTRSLERVEYVENCAKTLESSIQNTHREIVSSLEQLLWQSNEIKNKLYGGKRFKTQTNMTSQVRVLSLAHGEHQEATLYRVEKNWIIQFRLGPSLIGRKVALFCNYPKDDTEFKRNRYFQLQWSLDEGCTNADDTALHTNITAKCSGSFHYYFTYEEDSDNSKHQGSGYFIVDPVLKYGNNEELPLDCIQCQTVLAKSLGPFSSWERKLRVAKESGYNMIHFTPIQELGGSNSSYSLSEQLKLNKIFNGKHNITFWEVEEFMKKIRKEWKMTSICDIVLNHTANESAWLTDHPEATYNCLNCPYLRPAYLLDAALHQFTIDIKNGIYEDKGIPTENICNEAHLNAIKYALHTDVLKKIKLQELYICDVTKLVSDFATLARNKVPRKDNCSKEELKIVQDNNYRRLASTVDMETALRIFNVYRNDCFDEETRIRKCTEDFKLSLDNLNSKIEEKLNKDLNVAVENCLAGIRYFRVQTDGPKLTEISQNTPLVYRYFTDYAQPKSLEEHEEIMYGPNSKYLMAHNGWVMDADPLHNFASDVKVYLRRELIAWGDSVKLRYGDKPEDSPFLWNYMREYVESTARIFDGVRLDNCHSTPIPVAEYLLDAARKIKPDLYVVAELFTNSDQKDNIFVNRLGITSLIREAMSAWDSHELGRLVYRYGGYPVGAFYQPNVHPLVPSVAHALFLDLTHDNPSPVEKRSVFDMLPSTALVSMACCASGSNRGYDELVPHHIHVVDEVREYTEWTEKEPEDAKFVSEQSGIIAAKRALNDLHFYLGSKGYNQVYVDQMDSDIVAVTRHNPVTHESVILVAFTAFKQPDANAANTQPYIKPLRVEGKLDEIILEASLQHKIGSKFDSASFAQDNKYINGYTDYELVMKEHVQLEKSEVLAQGNSGDCNVLQLEFKSFKPGSVVAIKTSLPEKVGKSVKILRELISNLNRNDLIEVIGKLNLADYNRILYRCDQEERDEGHGFGAYDIPDYGPMVYCGLQGIMSLLYNIRPNNDLGHPLCVNLRNGNWLIEYVYKRLKVDEGTKDFGIWLENNLQDLMKIPRYLIPAYFDAIITGIYVTLLENSYQLMSDFVKNGSTFVRGLALGSIQFGAVIKSAKLPELSPNLENPKPPQKEGMGQSCVSLSAGLPHFTIGYMRNWGRDTFIALRGLFILTGRYQEARYHILAYAACLRHGLIPNLLDGGKNSRFNCRDAVWWWLYCIKSYVQEAPNGLHILKDKVSRIFPKDDAPAQEPGTVDQPLCDVMQEALRVHFQGLVFRERNAGRTIDEHMSDKGFNNQIGVHPETGFIFGGNEANCGTWMDKMGSSEKAGIRGKPATPRDGSAVEIIGLSKSVVSWLDEMSRAKKYPYDCVERKHKNGSFTKWTFKAWSDKIAANFENCFWIGSTISKHEKHPELINKKNIYKDSFGASQTWADYQMRCNYPIAMVAAPEMFDPTHAWLALNSAEKHLLGPLGMKTLDSSDWNYCGDYDNSNDSNDKKIAHGFNYHQGPEWVWPVGFYLRAKLIFAEKVGELKPTIASTKEVLSRHFTELQVSEWRGLPELTNSNGTYCKDSSRTQAWSMSTILEVLYDLQRIESKEPIKIN